jgi:hypothetical protein
VVVHIVDGLSIGLIFSEHWFKLANIGELTRLKVHNVTHTLVQTVEYRNTLEKEEK